MHLLGSLDDASAAVEAVWNRLPFIGHLDHVASVQNTVAEQVVELQPRTVDGPVVDTLGVQQMVALGGEDGQVLDITPGQVTAGEGQRKQLT